MPYGDIPDHPVIRNMERTGWPDGKEPEYPHCPSCFLDEIGEAYVQSDEGIVGCPACIDRKDADQLTAFTKDSNGIPTCPVCGAKCEWGYVTHDGSPVGCDECVTEKDAWELSECFHGTDRY